MEQAQQNYARMEAHNRGEWYMLGITVTMSILGIEIESASLWGIESDSDSEYIEQTISDLIAECTNDAKHKVADMQEIVHILEKM
jgi:DNA-binding protein YbaB